MVVAVNPTQNLEDIVGDRLGLGKVEEGFVNRNRGGKWTVGQDGPEAVRRRSIHRICGRRVAVPVARIGQDPPRM